MAFARALLPVFLFMALIACDKKDPAPPGTGDPPLGEGEVTGRERLGWMQRATDAFELGAFQYVVYVDGTRLSLTNVSCSSTPTSAGFECSASLPAMSAGPHSLEVAAVFVDPTGTFESTRSEPLRVVMVSTASTSRFTSIELRTQDGIALVLEEVVDGLRDPVDLAFSADGAVFIAEHAGTVRVVRDGLLGAQPALDLSDEIAAPGGGLLAMALDRGFERTAFVYALYAAAAGRGDTDVMLARFRVVNDRFGERAVLLTRGLRSSSSTPSVMGALRVGGDGKLYVGTEGEILRLNGDGTTPDDQEQFSPVYSADHAMPRTLDWHPATSALWIVEGIDPSGGRLTVAVPVVDEPRRGFPRTAYRLPSGTGPASAAFYRGAAMPAFRGDLFIAAKEGHELMRLRFSPEDASRVIGVERLLTNQIGPIRVVAEARDGALYVASDTSLYRLRPVAGGLAPTGW